MYPYLRRASLIVVLLLVFSGVSTLSASADGRAAQRGYLIGVPPNVGPDIARAGNGDTIEFTGTGTFTPGSRRATGFGFFVHKNVAGDTLAVGSWTATRLLSFRSFGSASQQGEPQEYEGGRASIRVHLAPLGAESGNDAVLLVNCLLGSPPAGVEEGIQLRVRGGPEFTEQVSGETLFINLGRSGEDRAEEREDSDD